MPQASTATAAEVLREALAADVERLVAHGAVIRDGTDPEGVHQARVAARRLRSTLRTFRPVLDAAWAGRLRDELRWLADALGGARDLDVLAGRLESAVEALPATDQDAVRPALVGLGAERDAAWRRAVAALDDRRTATLLDALREAAAAPAFGDAATAGSPAADVVPALAGRTFRKLRARVRQTGDAPSDEELHQIRIRAKRARYAAEVAVPIAGKAAKRTARDLARLQDVLGDHHDCTVAAAWLRGRAAGAPGAEAFVLGALAAGQRREAADLAERWRAAWARADRAKRRRWLA